MKRIPVLLITSLILFSGCSKSETQRVDTYTYGKQEINTQCILSGTIVPLEDTTEVETKLTQCKVSEIHVKTGDVVKAGDKLCTLDLSDIEKQIAELQQEMANTANKNNVDLQHYENELAYAKDSKAIELGKIQSDIDYQQKLYDEAYSNHTAAVAEYDAAVVKSDEYKAQLDAASTEDEMNVLYEQYMECQQKIESYRQSADSYRQIMQESEQQLMMLRNSYDSMQKQCDHAIEVAQLELDSFKLGLVDTNEAKLIELQEQLTEAVICAPCDGVVSYLTVQEGRACTDGLVATIAVSSNMQLQVSVSDEYILFIDEGEPVTFLSSAMNHRTYEGNVVKISNIKGEEGYDVYAAITDASELLNGMTATVTFTLESATAYAVPNSAITRDTDGNQIIYTLESMEAGGYTAKSHIISTGISNQSYTEIVDGNLQEGAIIVLNPQEYQDGQLLLPNEQKVTE